MMTKGFRLEVRLDIAEVDIETHEGQPPYERPTPNRLNVSESIPLGTLNFRDMLAVLAGLHDAIKVVALASEVCPDCRLTVANCDTSGCGQRQAPGWRSA